MNKLIFIVIFLAFGFAASTQSRFDKLKNFGKHQDSTYIYHFTERFSLKPYLSFRSFSLKLTDLDGFGNPIIYKPNTPMRLGFAGSYKGIRLGISFRLPSFYPERGETHSFGFFLNTQTSIFSWGLDFYFLRNKGYYLANPELNIPNWDKSQAEPFRSDIRTINAGIATHMVFSRKFSLKAATIQTEKQLKSAGGIALDLAIKYAGLWNDSTIIPFSQKKYYDKIYNFRKGGFLTLAISPGYAYTYVYSDFYSTTLAYLGAGIQIQTYQNQSKRSWSLQIKPKVKFMEIVGYNMGKYFANVSFTYETNLVKINDTRFNSSFINFSLGGGMRFN
jgi:hypothetical protein